MSELQENAANPRRGGSPGRCLPGVQAAIEGAGHGNRPERREHRPARGRSTVYGDSSNGRWLYSRCGGPVRHRFTSADGVRARAPTSSPPPNASSAISVRCPTCKKVLRVPSPGPSVVACPACKKKLKVPAPASAEGPPVPVAAAPPSAPPETNASSMSDAAPSSDSVPAADPGAADSSDSVPAPETPASSPAASARRRPQSRSAVRVARRSFGFKSPWPQVAGCPACKKRLKLPANSLAT